MVTATPPSWPRAAPARPRVRGSVGAGSGAGSWPDQDDGAGEHRRRHEGRGHDRPLGCWRGGCQRGGGGDRGADVIAKPGRGEVAGGLGELAAAAGQADLLPAGLAGEQVGFEAAACPRPHGGQVGRGELTGVVAHRGTPGGLAGWRWPARLRASVLRPRCTRAGTVPRGAPVMAATWVAVNPRRSIRVIAIRWLAGRAAPPRWPAVGTYRPSTS